MIKLWDIKLYQKKKGKYKAVIINNIGKKVEGIGKNPREAYGNAEVKLIVKPWLKNSD
uniref:Uncharacterized protein n=1 Tax=viral metagenome TaxID=1070528 RepID=A0A6M3J3Y2_9ZZZZ